MKFSPSSSIFSSTTCYSPNICTSKVNVLRCFSRFLSKILNPKPQPTYPFESENQQQEFSKLEKNIETSVTTNVVARLMGLDYMPKISSKDDQKDWNSINSGDFREKTEEIKVQHTRVKPSFSVWETPNYFELEDDNFIVLRFQNKSKKGSKLGHNRKEKCRKKQGKNRENCLEVRKCEVVCELENCSPISVLDDSEFISEYEVTTASNNSEEDAISRGSECDTRELSTSSNNGSSIEDEIETSENGEMNNFAWKRRDYKKHDNMEILHRVIKLAEVDLNNSNWMYKEMFRLQEVKEIGLDFSQQIFDHLLNELVDQLV